MPPLPRPARRLILTACLLLLAGAVVNVAVAWTFSGAPRSWTPGGPRFSAYGWNWPPSAQTLRASRAQRLADRLRPSRDAPPAHVVDITEGLGWSQHFAASFRGAGIAWDTYEVQAGWPLRSMATIERRVVHQEPQRGWEHSHSSSVQPRNLLNLPFPRGRAARANAWFMGVRSRLPLTPIPTGFVINTVFYTAVLAVPFALPSLRRSLRTRRGRCPKCGYDHAGLGNGAISCPECGAAR